MLAVTLFATEQLPFARVLARSLLANHPDARFFAIARDGRVNPSVEPFELIDGREVADMLARLTAGYAGSVAAEFPWLADRVLDRASPRSADVVLYLDPLTKVYGPLDDVIRLAREHGAAVVPGATAPLRPGQLDDVSWSDVVAVAKCGRGPLAAITEDAIVRDAGYSASLLDPDLVNVQARPDGYVFRDQPLRLCGFAGTAGLATVASGGVARSSSGALRELCDDYRHDLIDAGFADLFGLAPTIAASGPGGAGRTLEARVRDLAHLIRAVRADGAGPLEVLRHVFAAVRHRQPYVPRALART